MNLNKNKMNNKIHAVALLLSVANVQAQITFQKTYGGSNNEDASSIRVTSDGGYIIAGYTESFGAGNKDVYLVKTDSTGDTLWTRTFGGSGDDWANAVQQTYDGGYIVSGYTTSFIAGTSEIYLLKTNSTGSILWSKTFCGTTAIGGGSYVCQTSDSSFIIVGNPGPPISGFSYFIKTDSNGDSLWTKTFGNLATLRLKSIYQTNDGGYILGGTVSSSNDYFYMVKTNSSGDTLWTRTFGGAFNENGNEVKQTNDGGYIMVGNTNSFGAGQNDVLLIKTDSSGISLWTKIFGGTSDEYGNSVEQTNDNGYIITGMTGSFGGGTESVYLVKTDINGDTLWTKTYGSPNKDHGNSAKQTSDGGYILAGASPSTSDVYLIKMDSSGNSGCNEASTATVVGSPIILSSNQPITIRNGCILGTPATQFGYGGIINVLCSSVGINDLENNEIVSLSPNPSSGNFTVNFNRNITKGNIKLFNIFGETVFEKNIFSKSKEDITLENISAGIYFAKIHDGERQYCKKIIIVQN